MRATISPASVAISTVQEVVVSIVETGSERRERARRRDRRAARCRATAECRRRRRLRRRARFDSSGYGRDVGARPAIEARRERAGGEQQRAPTANSRAHRRAAPAAAELSDRPMTCFTATRLAEPPVQVALSAASIFQPSCGSTPRNSRYTMTIATRMLRHRAREHREHARADLENRAQVAGHHQQEQQRRQQVARSARAAPTALRGVGDHRPPTASAVTNR